MLATSKMSYFQVITTDANDPSTSLAGAQAVIKVSDHQYQWVISRWLWPGNRTFLEMATIVISWWMVAFGNKVDRRIINTEFQPDSGRWTRGLWIMNSRPTFQYMSSGTPKHWTIEEISIANSHKWSTSHQAITISIQCYFNGGTAGDASHNVWVALGIKRTDTTYRSLGMELMSMEIG